MDDFLADLESIDTDILDIYKYLMKKEKNKIMFGLIKQVFIT